MRLDDVTPEDLVRADTAVVAALRRREATALGESERPRALEERVLLLDAEPRVERPEARRHLGVGPAGVRGMRIAADQHDFAEHELVVAAADRIGALEYRLKDAVGPIAGRLLRARPVEGPDRRLFAARHDLRLRTQLLRRRGAVDPDVFGAINAHGDPFSRGFRKRRLTARLYRIPHQGDDRRPSLPDPFSRRCGYIVMRCANRSWSRRDTGSGSSPAVRRWVRTRSCFPAWAPPP